MDFSRLKIPTTVAFTVGILAAIYQFLDPGQSARIDTNSLLPTCADLPEGWSLGRDNRGYVRNHKRFALHHWVGPPVKSRRSRTDPFTRRARGVTRVLVAATPERAWGYFELEQQSAAMRHKAGSYSGRTIGDFCFRGSSGNHASLIVGRGPVLISVNLSVDNDDPNPAPACESAAVALVERVDAALQMTHAQALPLELSGRPIIIRMVGNDFLTLLDEFSKLVGATATVNVAEGWASVSRRDRTLRLRIGRREAWLNGKPLKLSFPALRHGASQVYCPIEALLML